MPDLKVMGDEESRVFRRLIPFIYFQRKIEGDCKDEEGLSPYDCVSDSPS